MKKNHEVTKARLTVTKTNPKVEIHKHFSDTGSKYASNCPGVECMPYVIEVDENVTTSARQKFKISKNINLSIKSPNKKRPLTENKSSTSLDKKINLLNQKITALETEIDLNFHSRYNLEETPNNTPEVSLSESEDNQTHSNDPPQKPTLDFSRLSRIQTPKCDSLYELKNEIANYRKSLLKDVLPEKIERILAAGNEGTSRKEGDKTSLEITLATER